MFNKLYFLLPVWVLTLSACTLDPSRFTGTDLLAPDMSKKEEVKKTTIEKITTIAPVEPRAASLATNSTAKAEIATRQTISPPKPVRIAPVMPPAKPVEKQTECAAVKKADIAQTQTIKKNDRIKITVFRESDLTGVYQVDDAGNIAFPMIGKTAAANQTAKTLQDNIRKKLSSGYLVNPDVTAQILPDCNEK